MRLFPALISIIPVCFVGFSSLAHFDQAEMVFSPHDGAGVCETMTDVNGLQMIPTYYYFWNLEANFPTNRYGDCTWIAVTMYLSYLATVARSDIISDPYYVPSYGSTSDYASFAESPGTIDGDPTLYDGVINSFYKWFVSTYTNDGFSYPVLQYNPLYLLHYSLQATLLRAYFDDLSYSESADYFVIEYPAALPGESMYNHIVNELQSGRPVIANTPAHSFIIYGYVPNTHQFVIHNGWKNGHSHDVFDWDSFPENNSPGIQYVISAGFYVHTHNYCYYNGNAVYCSCGDDAWAVPYIHKHEMEIQYYGSHHWYWRCTICGHTEGGI